MCNFTFLQSVRGGSQAPGFVSSPPFRGRWSWARAALGKQRQGGPETREVFALTQVGVTNT